MKNVTMFPCLRFFIFAHSDRDLARLGLYHLLSRDIHEVATLEGQVAYADWKEYNKGTYDISLMVNDYKERRSPRRNSEGAIPRT